MAYGMGATISAIENLIWKVGGNFSFWFTARGLVGEFIEKNELQPVEEEFLIPTQVPRFRAMEIGSEIGREELLSFRLPFPWRYPGIPTPHLHFKGEIYPLNEDQWRNFSQAAVSGIQEKLESAQTMTYGQLMELTEAVGKIL